MGFATQGFRGEKTVKTPNRRRRSWARALAVLGLAAGLASSAEALPIATWDLANATGQDAAVLSTALNVSATLLDDVGVTDWPNTSQDGFVAARGWSSDPNAYDPGRYFEWSVTAAAGFQITFETLDLALFRGIQGVRHGAEKWALRASDDGFASTDVDLGVFDISASGADVQTLFAGHDISALGTRSGTVTFRLHGYDQTAANDYSGLGNDDGTWLIYGSGTDLTVSGTVAPVPETRRGALAAMGLVGLAVIGRRRLSLEGQTRTG
jgi:hypothetical protein